MKKSLNNKRNEITEQQIRHLTRVYGNYQDGDKAEVLIDGKPESRVISPHLREPGVRLPQSDGRAPFAHELRGNARAHREA